MKGKKKVRPQDAVAKPLHAEVSSHTHRWPPTHRGGHASDGCDYEERSHLGMYLRYLTKQMGTSYPYQERAVGSCTAGP